MNAMKNAAGIMHHSKKVRRSQFLICIKNPAIVLLKAMSKHKNHINECQTRREKIPKKMPCAA